MKPLVSAIVYIVIGLVFMRGILLATHGSYTLLIAAILSYILLVGTIGCLPRQSH